MRKYSDGFSPSSLLESTPLKRRGVSTTERLYQELNSELRWTICTEIFINPVVTPCDHVFCKHCIETMLLSKKMKSKWPMCRRPLFKRELQSVSIFAKACSIIRRLKEDNNMCTQIEPAKRFEIRPIEAIKKSLQKK